MEEIKYLKIHIGKGPYADEDKSSLISDIYDDKEKVQEILKKLGISEYELLSQPKINKKYQELFRRNVSPGMIREVMEKKFKPSGPMKKNSWLSNFDVDNTLKRYAYYTYKQLFVYPFVLLDFKSYGGELEIYPLDETLEGKIPMKIFGEDICRKNTTAACIVNSDYSGGPGKHWTAIFVDTRGENEWSIEFFNSSGKAAYSEIQEWIDTNAVPALKRLKEKRNFEGEIKVYSDKAFEHQKVDGPCGLYSITYILIRLENPDINPNIIRTGLKKHRLTDEQMNTLRSYLFISR